MAETQVKLMDADQIDRSIKRIAHEIIEKNIEKGNIIDD